MPQSSIGFMVALAIFVCVAFLTGTRYRTVRPRGTPGALDGRASPSGLDALQALKLPCQQ
jgi:hypothetical protein